MEDFNLFRKKESNKSLVQATIELALLNLSQECFEKVTTILKTDYNCTISDCYDHPEYLNRILKDFYGNASSVIVDYIKKSLEEYTEDKKIFNLLKLVCK